MKMRTADYRGFEVIGIFMKIWYGTPLAFLLFDLTREYKSTVLDYFKREYIIGSTPNPCIRYNQKIKFKVLLEKAEKYGVR